MMWPIIPRANESGKDDPYVAGNQNNSKPTSFIPHGKPNSIFLRSFIWFNFREETWQLRGLMGKRATRNKGILKKWRSQHLSDGI